MAKADTGYRSPELVAVAVGKKPADIVLKNGKLVNVNTGEIEMGIDVALYGQRIALVGDAEHTIGPDTEIVNADGCYLTPGFMDGHIHVESSMVTLTEYSKTVIPRGTTAIFMDPHEIANVMGMDGVKIMIDEGKEIPLRVFTTVPSCVPAAPGFEDNGAVLTAEDIEDALKLDNIIGLGEMMNYPGVLNGDEEVHKILEATRTAGKVITGHYAQPDIGAALNAYIAAGIRCCHESTRAEEALAKMRRGMYAQIREGSAWHDLKETIKSITENNIDSRMANLVSDDTHPHTLLTVGHLDHIVKRAIEEGLKPVQAIQMVTLNVARCFGIDTDYGSISPGKIADIVILNDLTAVNVDKVIIGGEMVAEGQEFKRQLSGPDFPDRALNTVNLPRRYRADDFIIKTERKEKSQVRIIEVIENKTGTVHNRKKLPVKGGQITAIPARDIQKVAVIERHSNQASMSSGFVRGFGLKRGAVAATVAHDSHNLLVVGVDEQDMALAVNELAESGGGLIVTAGGGVLAHLPLPVAGLMSMEPIQMVNNRLKEIRQAWQELGSELESPFMTMALLALPVLPEIRITNRGLVDTVKFEFVELEI